MSATENKDTNESTTVDDLSDTAFNYDVDKNWSMIFTDDNSIDHDLHSNYSSSADDVDTNIDVVSEAESTFTNSIPISKGHRSHTPMAFLYDKDNEDTPTPQTGLQSNSVSTIKVSDSYQLPDPLKQDTHISKVKASEKNDYNDEDDEDEKPQLSWDLVKGYIIYLIISVLVVDKGLQLFDVYPSINIPWSKKESSDIVQSKSENNILTFVRYIPDKNAPKSKVSQLSVYNGEASSWDLVKMLYINAANNVAIQSQNILENYKIAQNKVIEEVESVDWERYLDSTTSVAKNIYDRAKEQGQNCLIWIDEGSEAAKEVSNSIINRISKDSKDGYNFLKKKAGEYEVINPAKVAWEDGKKLDKFLKDQDIMGKSKEFFKFAADGANSLWVRAFN